ncbi:protein FAM166C isoform X3 [Fukomys damarensis]|uniref:protein FAM166C isoform X3 n=1 Tax=Fukomys damarensis TaxID=885580 RepID=UPI0008FF43C2|nr:protein FAM166C isoform X3 [Fukomys damarensis]
MQRPHSVFCVNSGRFSNRVSRPCPRRGLLLRLTLWRHHSQVLPGPPQHGHGEEPHTPQRRRLLPHHLLPQPQPGVDGPLEPQGPLAAPAQLYALQPGRPPHRGAGALLPATEGAAAPEVLQRQDRHSASGTLLRAACEGEGRVPHPHRPASSEPQGEVASFESLP